MKRKIAILLVCFFLVMCPIRGYAAAVPTTFGVGVEVILPFLLSLLGVQAKNEISTYQELEAYHDEVYNELVDGLAGIAGANVIQNWLIRAASGIIDTDSIIWGKLVEFAVASYAPASSSSIVIPSDNIFNLPSISFGEGSFTFGNGSNYCYSNDDIKFIAYPHPASSLFNVLACSSNPSATFKASYNGSPTYDLKSSFTYNNNVVYYYDYAWSRPTNLVINDISADLTKYAWLAVYGGYVAPSDAVGNISDSFSDVLSSNEQDNIVDGTSVIQLYNPSALQNGLEIIPGGDPEDDPNLKKIPFAITADWWNLLEQFGNDAVNQSVAAYNALNNLDDGTSTGTISRAWDSLGIASVVGSAQNAQEGIIDLTQENIYPRSSTVQQTVTDSIPSSLTPEAPDSGIDNESEQGLYKLPDLRDYFPFCIPFDLIDFLGIFVAEPETPQFVIALNDTNNTYEQSISLERMNDIAAMVRNFELAGFVLALILVTRNLIRG